MGLACLFAGWFSTLEAPAQSDADIQIHIIPRLEASMADVATPLPTGEAQIPAGVPYVLEVWLGDVGTTNTGLVSAFVDVFYSTQWADAVGVSHSGLFSTLLGSDVIDDAAGRVGDFGGTNSGLTGQGIEPAWARLGWIDMVSGLPPSPVPVDLSAQVSIGGVGCFGRICGPVEVIGHDFTIVPEPKTGLLVCLSCLLLRRNRFTAAGLQALRGRPPAKRSAPDPDEHRGFPSSPAFFSKKLEKFSGNFRPPMESSKARLQYAVHGLNKDGTCLDLPHHGGRLAREIR